MNVSEIYATKVLESKLKELCIACRARHRELGRSFRLASVRGCAPGTILLSWRSLSSSTISSLATSKLFIHIAVSYSSKGTLCYVWTSVFHKTGNIIQLIQMFNFVSECRLTRVNPDCKVRYLPHPRPVDNCLAKITKVSSSNGYWKSQTLGGGTGMRHVET
jgi:hypothetical protein